MFNSKSVAKAAAHKTMKQLGGKWGIDIIPQWAGRFHSRKYWYGRLRRGSLTVIQYSHRSFSINDNKFRDSWGHATTIKEAVRGLYMTLNATATTCWKILKRFDK